LNKEYTLITNKEITAFWNKWDLIIISWNAVSFFGFPLIPFAYVLKYWFGVKGLWLLNDTVDGDFGDPNELKKAGRLHKSKFLNFWWWWFRNHSWNYICKFKPSSNGGGVYEHRVLIGETYNPVWLKEKGIFHVCYRGEKDGRIECRYSEITDKVEKHFGAGGFRYKLHYKLR